MNKNRMKKPTNKQNPSTIISAIKLHLHIDNLANYKNAYDHTNEALIQEVLAGNIGKQDALVFFVDQAKHGKHDEGH